MIVVGQVGRPLLGTAKLHLHRFISARGFFLCSRSDHNRQVENFVTTKVCVCVWGGGGGGVVAGAVTSIIFVATKVFTKTSFVVRKIWLSRQNYVCRDKTFVATNITLSPQKTCLSRQKWYLWQLPPMIGWEICMGKPPTTGVSLAGPWNTGIKSVLCCCLWWELVATDRWMRHGSHSQVLSITSA